MTTPTKPTDAEVLYTSVPAPDYAIPGGGWYCRNHPTGEYVANEAGRDRCWACDASKPVPTIAADPHSPDPMVRYAAEFFAHHDVRWKAQEKVQQECDELRELLIDKALPDQIACAEMACPGCGERITSRLGTELKFSRDGAIARAKQAEREKDEANDALRVIRETCDGDLGADERRHCRGASAACYLDAVRQRDHLLRQIVWTIREHEGARRALSELAQAIDLCESDGGCRATAVLKRLRSAMVVADLGRPASAAESPQAAEAERCDPNHVWGVYGVSGPAEGTWCFHVPGHRIETDERTAKTIAILFRDRSILDGQRSSYEARRLP